MLSTLYDLHLPTHMNLIILSYFAGFRETIQIKDPQEWDDRFYVVFRLEDIPDTQIGTSTVLARSRRA